MNGVVLVGVVVPGLTARRLHLQNSCAVALPYVSSQCASSVNAHLAKKHLSTT